MRRRHRDAEPRSRGKRVFSLMLLCPRAPASPRHSPVPFARPLLAALVFTAASAFPLDGAEPGESVVVVFNSKQPESKAVAQHYATRRKVPAAQVIGLPLPAGDSMSRADFNAQLQTPLLHALESKKLVTFGEGNKIVAAKARHLVLCFGVPLKIARDATLVEPEVEKLPEPLRRNEASVDGELALLPFARAGYMLAGPRQNPHFGATNAAALHPTNGLMLVARLDGPTADIARGLVDKAMQAESDGLWGRAWFDARGLTNGPYAPGDAWIRGAAAAAARHGFETVLDERPETLPAATPLSHVALYAGWYDANASGPFARAQVEFVPGAVAYHLHSFSAQTLRTGSDHWCGPLLARGATATMGSVNEPYLGGTPDVRVFFERFVEAGFSFGEAASAAQGSLSWQTTVIGDPLYRPFGKSPREQHEALAARKSRLIEWSHLMVVNRNLARGTTPAEMVGYLRDVPESQSGAVLLEKLADLHAAAANAPAALEATARALELQPSPQQNIRLLLALASRRATMRDAAGEHAALERLFTEAPDYAGRRSCVERLLALAQQLNRPADSARWKLELGKF